MKAESFFQHGDQQRRSVVIEPLRHSPAGPEFCARNECLYLDKHRPRAFHTDRDDRAGGAFGAFLQEELRRIADSDEATAGHLENADLIGGAETVFRRADNAVVVVAVALEIQHRIDYVFERL